MYQLVSKKEHDQVLAFLEEAPEINAHLMTLLLRYGFDSLIFPVWIRQWGGELVGVFCIINDSAIVYEATQAHYTHVLDFLRWRNLKALTGPGELVVWLSQQLPHRKCDITHVSRLDNSLAIEAIEAIEAFEATVPNKTELCARPPMALQPFTRYMLKDKIALQNDVFQLQIDPFHEGIHQMFEKGMLKGYAFYVDKLLVACGEWLDEHPEYGMIAGIATRPEYRRQGMAQRISIQLSLDILKAGKTPLLRYSNEDAGRLYHKLGYYDIGDFGTLYF